MAIVQGQTSCKRAQSGHRPLQYDSLPVATICSDPWEPRQQINRTISCRDPSVRPLFGNGSQLGHVWERMLFRNRPVSQLAGSRHQPWRCAPGLGACKFGQACMANRTHSHSILKAGAPLPQHERELYSFQSLIWVLSVFNKSLIGEEGGVRENGVPAGRVGAEE